MSKTILVWSCAHADPSHSNERFDWLGSLIYDLKPDMCIDLGDGADMRSLNSFDTRYPQAIVSQSYEADITSYNNSQERLRHKFKFMKRKRPYWVGFEGNHECFQGHTEIYTQEKGWCYAEEVCVGDTVLTLSGWETVTNTHKLWHEGPMVGYEARSGVFSVTPSHRVYYYGSSGKLHVKRAKDTPKSLDLPVSTQGHGEGVDLTKDQLEFNAVAMTDSFHKEGKVVFYQSGEKAGRIEQIIKSCGVPYRKVERNRSTSHICGKELKSIKTSYEFHMDRPEWCVASNKSIPFWVNFLTEEQFEVLLDVLVFCDGSVPTKAKNSRVFYGQLHICEGLQLAAQLHGYRATVSEYRKGQYRVNLTKSSKLRVARKELKEIKDWVYCITVPSGNFFARQGGFSCFTGNCRIKTAIKHDPRLEGDKYGISFSHLNTKQYFDEYHEYEYGGPAIARYEGIDFAHFFSAGNFGTAMSGKHHAYTLLQNRHNSSVCGHSHKRGVYFADGPKSIGMVVGCMKGGPEGWAGQSNSDWWKGVVVLNEVDGSGMFEPQFISLKKLEEVYGS